MALALVDRRAMSASYARPMPPFRPAVDLHTLDGVKAWLRHVIRDYRWNVNGILLTDNRVVPLPKEPALVAKVIEVTVIEHFKRKAMGVPGLDVFDDLSGRGYPDVTLAGSAVGGRKIALDVKVARREPRRDGPPIRTRSRITLGPFDSYFRRPDEPIPGVGVPYGGFTWHLDLIVVYDWDDANVENVEILVVETWRVASMKRSSTTRNYMGAVNALDDLRSEQGDFSTIEEFYQYWRSMPVKGAAPPLEPEALEPEEAIEEGV